ncbi:Oidioi.mRNA.OKI2018_I69.chr1.g3795.t1.cds [Oikopleura dioica]|uniref:Oidioi.mRNA.OKI2018_I69.chr1.g3795.t1.cds n=1 Tax=Oikopleura dioica TaxID=34765 RepID=A0ABN7T4F0_OIKDI|nr:Oidioi.mRNA.OKI2018_I69.chr1.g3795.t1.cds [Oikopleura dioica]
MRLDTSFETSGLWERCEIILQKSVTCHPLMRMIGGYYNQEYRSILLHRFLVIAANVIQLFAVIFGVFGLKCTNLAHRWKRCSLTTAASGALTSAVLLLVSTSLYEKGSQ